MADQTDPTRLIEALGLQPHPEGGWYREMWRAVSMVGDRPASSAILFLLEGHQRSHWHKVDGEEHWFWHAGSPVLLSIADEERVIEQVMLGPDILAGQMPQGLVPAHLWQASDPQGGWALFSCTVTPAFHFDGFILAPPGWEPGR